MDIFNEELINFWVSLNKNEVRYIMIGGVATNLHGYQRTTDDIDVWIDDTRENRTRFRLAMKEYCGTDYFMLETLQIVPGWTHFNLNNGMRLDLMVAVKGLEELSFEQCLQAAAMADLGPVTIPFLHINHLIYSKKAANRPKDQIDVSVLEKLKRLMAEDDPESGG
ncbi:hypothetical protein GWC95_02925 [Sediminibacterium roseum]|uniref:Nucleotidyl transferase AbiEii toxin, Type IV TA system n=1 Tax=Sediminibacterium roseum TaxID=1978412 RepID=A0ABW9ZRD1_9BACT|nr:hypothetical protein [Sediminibacterium roseum]NCI48859.1 hypothetical protein [Sediminibacterium roseum]